MGIQSTRDISRSAAIRRIELIYRLIVDKEYRLLEEETSEETHIIGHNIPNPELDIHSLDKWTNRMLEDVMDRPLFRFSYFDNYIVEIEE